MNSPMMACGHTANATQEGAPVCVICAGINAGHNVVVSAPDLTNRVARCAYCGTERPSSTNLAFFEYLGPGSPNSVKQCKNCGYYDVAHALPDVDDRGRRKSRSICSNFEPVGDKPDRYYCGCRGWD